MVMGILGHLPLPAFSQCYQSFLPLFASYAKQDADDMSMLWVLVMWVVNAMQNFDNPHPDGLDAHIKVLVGLLYEPDQGGFGASHVNQSVLSALERLPQDVVARYADVPALHKVHGYCAGGAARREAGRGP